MDERTKKEQRRQRFAAGSSNPGTCLVSRGETSLKTDRTGRQKLLNQVIDDFRSYYGHKYDESTLNMLLGPSTHSVEAPKLAPQTTMDLRKLREAMLSTKLDTQSFTVFLLSVRIGILLKHYQTYVPALSFLTDRIRANDPLINDYCREAGEVYFLQTIQILLSSDSTSEASEMILNAPSTIDKAIIDRLWMLMNSIITTNSTALSHLLRTEPNYFIKTFLSASIDKALLGKITNIMQKSFFQLPKPDFELMTAMEWSHVQPHVAWTETDHSIILRKRKN